MSVNPSTMRMGIAAILVGLVGAFGVRSLMDEEEPVVEESRPTKGLVPISTANLPEGRIIRKADVALVPMSRADMVEKGWNLSKVMMGETMIIGRTLRKRVSQGSPFSPDDFFLDGEGPQYELRPGYNASQILIHRAFGGHVDPGDVVDLSFMTHQREAKDDMPAIPRKTIKVARAINVLEVTRPPSSPNRNQRGEDMVTFTLEVKPGTATNIDTLRNWGDFVLTERPRDDIAVDAQDYEDEKGLLELLGIEEEEPRYGQPYWTTEYVRGGSFSARQFPISLPQISEDEQKLLEQYRQYKQQVATAQAEGGLPPPPPAGAAPAGSSVVAPPPSPEVLPSRPASGGGAAPTNNTTIRPPVQSPPAASRPARPPTPAGPINASDEVLP